MMATGNRQTNRLAGAVSPYLQSHAHQEVDWYPWGEEAFAEAIRRDVPVFDFYWLSHVSLVSRDVQGEF